MANRDFFRRLGLADEVAAPTLAKLRHPKNFRRLLLVAGPAVVLAGALFAYMAGGRYVSTDNAYVHAGKLTVATDVSGIVANVAVQESQKVEKGQVLFTLDQEPFRIALAGAEANLGAVRNQLTTLQATYRQKQAQVAQAKTDVAFYETSFQRQQDLLKRGVSAQATFDQAKRDLDAARERVLVAQSDAEATLATLGGNPDSKIEENPTYLAAQAQVDKARRDLTRTTVLAPIPGIVTNVDALQVGEYLPAAQAAFSLVSSADMWIEANPEGIRSHLAQARREGRRHHRRLSGPRVAGHRDQPCPGDGHGVLRAAGAERDRQLGEGRAARADSPRRADAGRCAGAAHRHERQCRDRHRPPPAARRHRRAGAAVRGAVRGGHRRSCSSPPLGGEAR